MAQIGGRRKGEEKTGIKTYQANALGRSERYVVNTRHGPLLVIQDLAHGDPYFVVPGIIQGNHPSPKRPPIASVPRLLEGFLHIQVKPLPSNARSSINKKLAAMGFKGRASHW